MLRRAVLFLLFSSPLFQFNIPLGVAAQDMSIINKQLDEVQRLLDSGDINKAVALLEQTHNEFPENASAALSLAQYFSQQQDYSRAIPYYEQAIHRLKKDPLITSDTLGQLHYELVNIYNELGQSQHFTKELYLRMFYHLDQAWPAMMAQPHAKQEEQSLVTFARNKISDYMLMIEFGDAVVYETPDFNSALTSDAQTARDRASNLILQSDNVAEVEKVNALKSLQARLSR